MEPITYKVRRAEDQSPLLEFVARHLSISKRAAKAILDLRNISVNGQRVWMARHALSVGDEVKVLVPPARVQPGKREKIAILYRDSDYVIANKPSGILSCGKSSSLEAILRRQLKAPDLQAVHRLDRETSGCLMFAFSEAAKERMVECFRAKAITKVYHAIVHEHMERGVRKITKPLGGQTAISNVRVLDSDRKASHVAVSIETGRTHQIRIHLASAKHPVLGDRKYAGGIHLENTLAEIPRQMLHAYELRFKHPVTDVSIKARAPLPGDFRDCLKTYRLT
ncbi:MAG: RluA family pseudouridine synthase [Verrucomicrobia bacterium]|jgi:23S rRNA pseudouridine1911/1915/1917 synthase|nr:RluA family pseudouridine synthase [Verrucomicrobiota bacterium]